MTTEDYKKLLPTLPSDPGVYRYIDERDNILYVGKAKNLKKRIASYFGEKKHQAFKTKIMIKHAHRIEYTLLETEQDALLLEATLIKKHQPRYNVMLKDGKTYVYICIKKERFPRVFFTRRIIRDGSTYFGPYTSKHRANILLDLVKRLFQLRTCTFNLSEENINKGKFKVCLEYHIKNCQGPCEGLESEESYNEKINQIKNILRGNFKEVKEYLKDQMKELSDNMQFEEAQQMKEKFEVFTDYQAKSAVVSSVIKDLDVCSIAMDEKSAYVNYLKVINGSIINAYTVEMTMNLNQDKKELLAFAVQDLRDKFQSISSEIVLPFKTSLLDPEIKITVPSRGEKKQLLDLSEKNVKFFLLQKQKEEINKIGKVNHTERILKTMQQDLRMDSVPFHIECFDNSNMQGSFPVASCVVFRNAKPSKKDYRHFNIKTVEGPDDFASMEEVVYRRYKRMLDEKQTLPQLIIVDGGKGQLSSAVKSLVKLEILDQVTIVGIAKRLEEIFFPGDSIPLYIDKKSESLKVIQQARNEAHRFAITFHRNKRSKNFMDSELLKIPGIGEKSVEKLLTEFGSAKKVKNSSYAALDKAVGSKVAKLVFEYYKD